MTSCKALTVKVGPSSGLERGSFIMKDLPPCFVSLPRERGRSFEARSLSGDQQPHAGHSFVWKISVLWWSVASNRNLPTEEREVQQTQKIECFLFGSFFPRGLEGRLEPSQGWSSSFTESLLFPLNITFLIQSPCVICI